MLYLIETLTISCLKYIMYVEEKNISTQVFL